MHPHEYDGTLPTGTYAGTWGGHQLYWVWFGKTYRLETKRGIRTPNCPVTFAIVRGEVDEFSIEPIGQSRPGG